MSITVVDNALLSETVQETLAAKLIGERIVFIEITEHGICIETENGFSVEFCGHTGTESPLLCSLEHY